jgi:D-glycero-D-manno-heptose 1,7-bisphosphate phosphatase
MAKKPALFLDRDGVINVDYDYVHTIEQFHFIDGIFELCRRAQEQGYKIVVVTNQSGIARGRYDDAQFMRLSTWMVEQFAAEGVTIDGIYYCPHHPKISGACACRKPEPGMLLDAANALDLDLARSLLLGDKERDIEAAIRAGVPTQIFYDPYEHVSQTKATQVVRSLNEVLC